MSGLVIVPSCEGRQVLMHSSGAERKCSACYMGRTTYRAR